MEEALMSYDGCSGLVGGFYGEFSKDVDRLIKLAAEEGAELHAAKYGLESSKQIRSVLANKIRTNWAKVLTTVVQAQLRSWGAYRHSAAPHR